MRVLVVCSGNTCRSPMAAALLCESLSIVDEPHEVTSAGTHAVRDASASALAVEVCREIGVPLAAHRARPLDAALIARADVVLCMERAHVDACRALAGADAAGDIRLLSASDDGPPGGEAIADPLGGGVEAYRAVRDRLRTLGDRFLAERGVVPYAPYWCEENVWQLLGDPRVRERVTFAVLVTNATRSVALWSQRAALVPGTPVVWDYHVVLVLDDAAGVEVWDLDCAAGRRLPLATWLAASFPYQAELPEALQPRFRVVPGARYREGFASTREHMRDQDGVLTRPAPPWPLIGGGAHRLDRYLDLETAYDGDVVDLAGLRRRFLAGGDA